MTQFMKSQTHEEQPNNEEKKRRWLLVILLLILILFTGLFLLWRLGDLAKNYMGHIVETVVLSPDQAEDLPLSLCGKVQYRDGTPAVGYEIELHSTVKYDITDEGGDFYFEDVGYGSHQLILLEEDGSRKVLANLAVERDDTISDGKQLFTLGEDNVWYFTVPTETLILEFDLVLDEEGGSSTLSVIPETVSAMLTDSWVVTYYGTAQASQEGPILTPHGSLMLTDGTVHLHVGGAMLPDGTYIDTDGNIYKNGKQIGRADLPGSYELNITDLTVITPDGSVIHLKDIQTSLPDGTHVDNQGKVTRPDGTVVDNRENIVITPGGYVIDADGKVTDPDGKPYEGDRLPDGTLIHPDGSITTPDGSVIKKPKPGHGYIIDSGHNDKPARPLEGGTYTPGGNTPSSDSEGEEDTPKGPGGNNHTIVPGTPEQPTPEQSTPEQPTPEQPQYIKVIDTETDKEWRQITTVDLFKNGGLIYPGASASYEFYLKNTMKTAVHYQLTISEASHEAGAVPLEYRLKDKSGYVAGTDQNWLTADELEAVWVNLKERGSIHYTLEWRWPYERGTDADEVAANDQADTDLGNAANREHLIQLKIYAETLH